jgi:hypothetical protein
MKKIYLDDVRTPLDKDWIVVRNFDEFVKTVERIGFNDIQTISLDHDLGESAMLEYHRNVSPNYKLDYSNINEKTGYDCAKWLVEKFYRDNPGWDKMPRDARRKLNWSFPMIYTHSANPIGSANIMGYINNFLMNEGRTKSCVSIYVKHTV